MLCKGRQCPAEVVKRAQLPAQHAEFLVNLQSSKSTSSFRHLSSTSDQSKKSCDKTFPTNTTVLFVEVPARLRGKECSQVRHNSGWRVHDIVHIVELLRTMADDVTAAVEYTKPGQKAPTPSPGSGDRCVAMRFGAGLLYSWLDSGLSELNRNHNLQ